MNKIYAQELVLKTYIEVNNEEFLKTQLTQDDLVHLITDKKIFINFESTTSTELGFENQAFQIRSRVIVHNDKELSDKEIAAFIHNIDKEIQAKLTSNIAYTALETHAIIYSSHNRYEDIKFLNQTVRNDDGDWYILAPNKENGFTDKVINLKRNKAIQSHFGKTFDEYTVSRLVDNKFVQLVKKKYKGGKTL